MAETTIKDPRPRRVLIIVENVSAPADRSLWSKATALAGAHYDVSVICPRRRILETSEETIDGIRVFRHPLPFRAPSFLGRLLEIPLALFWEFVLSIKIAWRYGFDVIHICNPPNIIFLIGAFYKIFARKRVLFDYRDANWGRSENSDNRGSLTERLAFKTADLCLSINESHRKIAISRGHIPAQRAIVLRPCPNLERVKAMQPDPLLRNGRAYMVAYAGEVSKAEGLDLLMDAIKHIVRGQQRADIQFVVAGTGPEWQEIAGICGQMELSDYVTFTGRVDDESLFTILSTADVCVDPRRITPNSAIYTSEKIIEYMAIGKPIVQFDSEEGRILTQEAARYAENNDPLNFSEQIVKLIDNPKLRASIGGIGQERVRKDLSWHHEQRKLLKAYDAVFGMRKKPLMDKQEKEPKTQKNKISKQR